MPFEQLHIFLIINLCIQAPDMELKAMDYVFPCCTGRILQYAQSQTGQTSSYHTGTVQVADKPTAPIHVVMLCVVNDRRQRVLPNNRIAEYLALYRHQIFGTCRIVGLYRIFGVFFYRIVYFLLKIEYLNFWTDKNAVEGRNTLLRNSLSKGLFCTGIDNVLIKLYLLSHLWTCKAENRLKIVYTNQKQPE
jgi:hypothetical protein